jgi:hypothetical protein
MPFNDPILSAVFWLGSLAWGWWIARSIQGRASEDRGQAIIQYGPGIRVLAVVAWIGAIGLMIFVIVEPGFPPLARVFISVCALFLAFVLHLELTQFHVRYDSTGIHVVSPLRADRVVRWDDFRRVRDRHWDDTYTLETESFGRSPFTST